MKWEWDYGGAVIAQVATFAITIPIRLYLVRKLIGGIYIPGIFFIKVFVTCFIIGSLMTWGNIGSNNYTLLLSIPVYFGMALYFLFLKGILIRKDLKDISLLIPGKENGIMRLIERVRKSIPILHNYQRRTYEK